MNDHVGNWNKTRTNFFFGHHVSAYLESLGAHGYLFNSLIIPNSLSRIKDYWNSTNEFCCLRRNIYLSEVSTFSNLGSIQQLPQQTSNLIHNWQLQMQDGIFQAR